MYASATARVVTGMTPNTQSQVAPQAGAVESLDRPAPAQRRVHFSPRERQIVRFIVEGCSNQEIANRMGLRLQTVKNHLSRVYRKVGVPNRVQLAVFAVGYGLADPTH
jgi:two-component system nitrate/nitrite response regulator NarL